MTVKEWLRQVMGIEARIKAKQEQLTRYRSMAMSSTAPTDTVRVDGGKGGNRVETGGIECADLAMEIKCELDQLITLRRDVAAVIRGVEGPRLRDVLEMHYLNGWSWQSVADEIGVDVSWVHRLHGRALIEADKIWRQSTKVH